MRRALAAAAAVFLTTVSPAAADTPTRSILHSDTRIDLRSDGGRYLAYQNDPTRLEVYDTLTDTTREVPLAGNCQLHDMVDGRILVSCTERGYLIGAASGKKTQLPGRVDWIALGKRWAGGYTSNESATRFVNLRTLRVTKKGSMPADLDGAEPPKPLPVGVQIRMHDGDLTFEWFTKTVNPPFDSRFTLTRRRAHRKPLRLLHARADAWPSGFELGSRFATWSVRVTAYGFDVKRRKRIKWTFPNAAPGEFHNPVHVAHTRRHVFFGVPVADGYELYVARRPG